MLPIIQLGKISIETYPFIMGLSWGIAYQMSRFVLNKHGSKTTGLPYFFTIIFLLSWIGSKLFFLLNLPPTLEKSELLLSQFVWLGGGFVFYGGLLFSLLYLTADHFFFKGPFHSKQHFFLAPLCFAHSLGRIGCFMAGCCYGKECELPWRVLSHGIYRHPVQLYESLFLALFGLFFLYQMERKTSGKAMIMSYLLGYSLFRFFIEFYRGDVIRGVYSFGLSFSQVFSLSLIALLSGYVLISKNNNQKLKGWPDY